MQAHITMLRQLLETMQLATVQIGKQVQTKNTTQTIEVQHTTSIISKERCVMKIAMGALEFPMA
jgi:stress response protein YsnF